MRRDNELAPLKTHQPFLEETQLEADETRQTEVFYSFISHIDQIEFLSSFLPWMRL